MTTHPTTRDALIAARALIENLEHWTKGAARRNADGVECAPTEAVSRCASAALWDAVADRRLLMSAYGVLYQEIDGTVWRFNDSDSTTHADVLAAYDRAIAAAEGK